MESSSTTAILSKARSVQGPSGQACLVYIYPTGSELGKRYLLGEERILVGRDADCQICLPHPSVSRKHAEIVRVGNTSRVVDLDSTNGIFINDEPQSTALLHDGDYLRIGACIFRFLRGGNIEANYYEEIHRLIILDGLTGLHNRRSFQEFVDRELSRSARFNRPLSLVIFDIDHFKTINDRFGHLAGDLTLQAVADRVKHTVRKEELLARYGGEEFALVLVECEREEALKAADRIREAIAARPFQFEDHEFPLTISLGVAATCGEEGLSVAALFQRADQHLYDAKRGGRNCVVG
jgi:diguanylate cyclase (GGDEF)-like protein